MKRNLREAICRINVMPSGPDAKSVSRGTGFLVAPNLILTALHVVADRKTDPPTPYPGAIQLDFPGHKSTAEIHDQYWDCKDDWVLLRCPAPLPVAPLALTTPQEGITDWLTFGFPDANPRDGMVQTGSIEDFNGTLDDAPVYQLLSRQAAAGRGAPSRGLSGGPVIVGQQVIGLLRFALMKEGETVAGTLYGCPVERAVQRCPSLLALQPPQAPTKLEVFDAKWRRHRNVLIGAVAVLFVATAGLLAHLGYEKWSNKIVATMPFKIEAEGGVPEELAELHTDVFDALGRGHIPTMTPSALKAYVTREGAPDFDKLGESRVSHVLEGRGKRVDDQFHFNLTLTKPSNGEAVWKGNLVHDANQLHTLPGAIAARAVQALHAWLSRGRLARVTNLPSKHPGANAALDDGRRLLDHIQMNGPMTVLLRFNDQHTIEMAAVRPADLEAPERLFLEAIKLDPKCAQAHARLAQTYALQIAAFSPSEDLVKKAKEALAAAEKLNPDCAEVFVARGHLKYRHEIKYGAALDQYLKALNLEPTNAPLLMTVGLTQRLLGETPAAIKNLEKATRANPQNWPMLNLLTETKRRQRDFAGARDYGDRAIKVAARSPLPSVERANLLVAEKGDVAAANRALRDVLQQHLVSVGDLFRTLTISPALFRLMDGDLKQKVAALSLDDANATFGTLYTADYYLALADVNAEKRQEFLAQAARTLEALVSRLPGGADPWLFLQLALAKAGLKNPDAAVAAADRAAALTAIDRSAALAEKNGDVICQMLVEDGRLTLHMLLGDHATALKLIETTLDRDSNYTKAWLKKDPLFKPLLADPKFMQLVGS